MTDPLSFGAESSVRSPRRNLLSDRSFLSDLSEVPASQEAESSRDVSQPPLHLPEPPAPLPVQDWMEDLQDIVVTTEEQPNPREECSPSAEEDLLQPQVSADDPRIDLMTVQRSNSGLFKFLSEASGHEASPSSSQRPLILQEEQPLSHSVRQAEQTPAPALDEPVPTETEPPAVQPDEVFLEQEPSPKFAETKERPAPLQDLEETKDEEVPALKSIISPPVHAVSDSSKFTFGPRAMSSSDSEEESQPRPSDRHEKLPDTPRLAKKEHPLVPRLKLELVKPYQTPKGASTLTYLQCLDLLLATNLTPFVQPLPPKKKSCWQGFLKCCGQTEDAAIEAERQCQQLFALDKRPLADQEVDTKLLQSLWVRLKMPTASHTPEWTSLGFTDDPKKEASTLGVLQMLFLACDRPSFTSKLLEASRKRGTQFSFARECLATVSLALRVLRTGALDEVVRETSSATGVFNHFFLGCLDAWLCEHIRSPGYVDWKMLEARVRKNPRALILHAQRNVL